MKVRYYKTDWESDNPSDGRLCRFEMLSKLIDGDIDKHPGLKPRLLHMETQTWHGSRWCVAIVVWE